MKWVNRFTTYNFKIFYQKKVNNSVNNSSRRLNYEKDIDADEREFICDLTYMRELLKNFLNQSASTLVIFTWQFKTLSIKNHEEIVIKSFKKITNLLLRVCRNWIEFSSQQVLEFWLMLNL